jgi:hypothetical protein
MAYQEALETVCRVGVAFALRIGGTRVSELVQERGRGLRFGIVCE